MNAPFLTALSGKFKRFLQRLGAASKPVLVVTGFLAVLLIIGLVNRFGITNSAPRATVASVPTVSVIRAERSKPDTELVLPGTLQPMRETLVYARASGYVKHWTVDIGAPVQAGQTLITIDSPEVDQDLAHAEASLASARANLQIAITTHNRSKELLLKKFVSVQLVDEQEAQMQARAADVKANESDVRRLKQSQAFEQVTAPFAGKITARNVEVGQLITANSTDANAWLYRVSAVNPLRLFITVPQSQAHAIVPGMTANVVLSEFPGRSFAAHVVRSAGALDPNSKTLLTEVDVPNDKNELASGGYAEAHITVKMEQPAIVLPANTVIARASGTRIAVVDQDNRISLKPVTLGRDFGMSVEVLTGINPGDRVITNPSDSVQEGASVSPVSATQP
jgi:membrane fusion protein (multidrug efflux system)